MSELKDYQVSFIDLALESQALEFGNFTLSLVALALIFLMQQKCLTVAV